MRQLPGVNLIHDLNVVPWPLTNGSFDRVVAEHILEHMADPMAFLREIHRVASIGALIEIEVPHWRHFLAHGMPDHRTTWAHNSFDPSYLLDGMFVKERVEFRLGDSPNFLWLRHTRSQWLGRQLCKRTGLVSGLRFYLRRGQ